MLDVMLGGGGVENWNSQNAGAAPRNRGTEPPVGGGGGYVMGGPGGSDGSGAAADRRAPAPAPSPGAIGWAKTRAMVRRGRVTCENVYGLEGDTPARPRRERAPSMRREVRRATSSERAEAVRRGIGASKGMPAGEPLPPNEFGRFNV